MLPAIETVEVDLEFPVSADDTMNAMRHFRRELQKQRRKFRSTLPMAAVASRSVQRRRTLHTARMGHGVRRV
jgi:hypothetical protein